LVMKILWFTNTPSLYDQGKHHYHGCGWTESLELLMKGQKEIELGVSFVHISDSEKVIRDGTTYYPIQRKFAKGNPVKKLLHNWKGRIEIINVKQAIEN